MANKKQRMFSLDIVDTDKFLELSSGARLLYYDLGIRADQEGFVGSPKSIMRITKASEEDMRSLIREQYVYPFGTGVVVILDFFVNNSLRKDRAIATLYQTEKSMLCYDEVTHRYIPPEGEVMATTWLPSGNQVVAQDKVKQSKNNYKTTTTELTQTQNDVIDQLIMNGIAKEYATKLAAEKDCQAIRESINYALNHHPTETINMPGYIISCIERGYREAILIFCPNCKGDRYLWSDQNSRMEPCRFCGGTGKITENTIEV